MGDSLIWSLPALSCPERRPNFRRVGLVSDGAVADRNPP